MAVFALNRQETLKPGVYPFDPYRHLRQVADLVSTVFAADLDAESRSALREVRAVGWLSPVLGRLLSATFLGEFVSGFVWIEDGRILGNLTLQQYDLSGMRWRISNVAVAAGHRGRGIGRSLMLAGLSEIAQRGGSWALLQVRPDNVPARRLYESLGFTAVCLDGVWRLPARPASPPRPPIPLQRLPALDWRPRFELAQAAQTQLAGWASPVPQAAYRVGLWQAWGDLVADWLGFYRVQRWGMPSRSAGATDGAGIQLDGLIEVQAHAWGDGHRLRMAVRPQARGQLERPLLSQGLCALAEAPCAPVVIEHSGDHAEAVAALEWAGFRLQRMLLTMRRPITPADALL